MKKLVCLVLILGLLSVPVLGSAQSLFADLVPGGTEKSQLPDYGAWMGVKLDDSEFFSDGSVAYIYYYVDQDDFEAFGEYLGELGYSITDVLQQDDRLFATLENGELWFQIEYIWDYPALAVHYPSADDAPSGSGSVSSASPASKSSIPDPFDGYVRVKLGEEFKVKGVGTFCVTDYTMDGSQTVCNHIDSMLHKRAQPKKITMPTWVVCNYLNTSSEWQTINSSIYLTGMSVDGMPAVGSLAKVKLHYVTEDDDYVYPMQVAGRYAESGAWGDTCEILTNEIDYGYVESMGEADIGICYDPPAAVRQSTDGILAITFEFLNGAEPHVVYLREE